MTPIANNHLSIQNHLIDFLKTPSDFVDRYVSYIIDG